MEQPNVQDHCKTTVQSSEISAELKWLNASELAAILGVKVRTVYNRLSKNPETLPPVIRVPGLRGPRWSLQSVRKWQSQFEAGHTPYMPRRRGRPKKQWSIATKTSLAP